MLDIFFERMKSLLGDEYDDLIDALKQPPYQAMHVNILKDPDQTIPQQWQLKKHPYVFNGYYFDKNVLPLGRMPYHDAGLYYIQEPSAMMVAELAEIKPGMRVIDLCAAPGGKTSKAAMMIGPDGLLIANDISSSRAKILSENVERLGLTNTIVTNTSPQKLADLLPGFFDLVILDAPCSGEGMFRKLDQAKTTWSTQKVIECSEIQKELIDCACRLLKDGGTMMYSTCTYEIEENEKQILDALKQLPFNLVPLPQKPGFSPGVGLEGVIRLYPHRFAGEGHFISRLEKRQLTPPTPFKQLKSNLSKQQMNLLTAFYQDNLNIPVPDHLYASGDHLYAIPKPYLDLSGIRILRQGLYLGECKKNRFEPSHSLALALKPEEVKRVYPFTRDSTEIQHYLHGDTLEGQLGNGFGVILVDGFPIGFVKEVNGILKNYYPKGLRKP